MAVESKILITKPSKDYELIDSGNAQKLERFGEIILRRPDPQALWNKASDWSDFHAEFVQSGRTANWKKKKEIPDSWNITIQGLAFSLNLSSFKHTGVFPEQSENWKWIEEQIKKSNRPISVLNLFGYTGGATLAAAKAGASVCHVDGSKVSISRAKENAELSGLSEKPIRWILDDAMKFVEREVRRGNKYDAIIMDPPAFGRGPKKEMWNIEDDFPKLISLCKKILSENPLFILINGYASGYSSIAYENSITDILGDKKGNFESGELAIESKNGRLLPAGIFSRWSSV